MNKPTECRTFDEFWLFYVKQHQKKRTRAVHLLGTSAALACLAGGLLTKRRWLLAVAPLVGYGPAWASHFFIEGNKPASFEHPLWSLRADLVMWAKMAQFKMSDEVERVLRDDAANRAAEGASSESEPTVEAATNGAVAY